MWLNIIWPFSIVFLKENIHKPKIRLLSIIFSASILACTILTFSRNAWLGLIYSTIFVLGFRCLKWFLPLLILIVTPVLIGLGFSPNIFLIELTQKFIPNIVFNQFNNLGFENFSSFTRVQIWNSALNFISEKPLTGWGPSSSSLFGIRNGGIYYTHSHNLPLEIALSFGLPSLVVNINYNLHSLFFTKKNL